MTGEPAAAEEPARITPAERCAAALEQLARQDRDRRHDETLREFRTIQMEGDARAAAHRYRAAAVLLALAVLVLLALTLTTNRQETTR